MEPVDDPIQFFNERGGLHDAVVNWISWGDGEFRLVVDNLNAAFMDGTEPSPDYPGYVAKPATLVFKEVAIVSGHLGGLAADWISEVAARRLRDRYQATIVGTASWMFAFDFVSLNLEPAGEPASVGVRYAQLRA
jgi:hypothetical protein